jgi:hypothetical protein
MIEREPAMTRAHRLIALPLGTGAALVWSSPALWAADLVLRPHIDTGVIQYQYDQKDFTLITPDTSSSLSGWEVNDLLPFVGGGLTGIYDRFFVDVYGQITAKGKDNASQTLSANQRSPDFANVFFPEGQTLTLDQGYNFNSQFDRLETSLSLGYQVTNNVTILGGYKYTKASFENKLSAPTFTRLNPIIDFNNITSEPLVAFSNPEGTIDLDFTYHGPFLGISYAIPIESWNGALQLTTAVTYLFGKTEQTFTPAPNNTTDPNYFNFFTTTGKGTSIGYNFGISWSGRITDAIGYNILADTSQYQFEGKNNSGDFSETTYRIRFSLGYRFGVGGPGTSTLPEIFPRSPNAVE